MTTVIHEQEVDAEPASTPHGGVPDRLREYVPIGIVTAAFLTAVLGVIALRTPLGHDESVYVLRARDIAELGWDSTSGLYWSDYRAPGGSLMLALLGELIGVHVTTSRALIAILAAVMVVSTWAIGKRFSSSGTGLVAAVLLAVTTGFVSTASTVLADVPGAAFSLVAVWLFGIEVQRGRLRLSLYLVPVLTLIACISRFGAPFMLGAGFIGVSIIVLPDVRRERNWVLAAQSVVLGVVVAFISWIVLFTEFVSIGGRTPVDANRTLIDSKELTAATGFRDLIAVVTPWSGSSSQLWSAPVAVMMLVGVIAATVAAVRGVVSRSFVVGVAVAACLSTVGIVASVGLVVNNYLALTLPYWTLLAGAGLVWLGRLVVDSVGTETFRSVAVGVAVVAASVLFVATGVEARRVARSSTHSYQPIRSAAVDLGETFDHRCVAVTSYAPQVGFYSACTVTTFSGDVDLPLEELLFRRLGPFGELLERGHQPAVFLVEAGKRQPPPAAFDSPAVAPDRLFEHSVGDGARETSWVQLIEPCVMEANC